MNHDDHNRKHDCCDSILPQKDTQNIVNSGQGVYTCPMHPEISQNKPGMCPECGMALVKSQKSNHSQHDHGNTKHAGHSTKMFLRKFWISLILTIPVVLYADVLRSIFNWSLPEFAGMEYMPVVLST